MPHKRKDAKHPVVKHGPYAHFDKWLKPDMRLRSFQMMERGRQALAQLFPNGLNAVAAALVDRAIYKSLKLTVFERMDIRGESMAPGAQQLYISMSNSLREDLKLLTALAEKKPPEAAVPTLAEYLERLKKANED